MRVLVTGATGHLGSHVARALVHAGHDVAIMARQGSSLSRVSDIVDDLRVIVGDLSQPATAASAILDFGAETVFHLGWYGVTGKGRRDARQFDWNVTGTLRLFEIAVSAGCRNWIATGSQAEYGDVNGLVHEDLPCRPMTPYGAAKLATGALISAFAPHDVRTVWLRLLATYGPADDERHLIPSVILDLLHGREPALTAGGQRWDYLFVADAVDALLAAAARPGVRGTYVLGSGSAETVRAIVEAIRDTIDPALPLGLNRLAYPVNQIMHLQADPSRFQAASGWKPSVSMAEGLALTIDWYRAKLLTG